MINASGTVYPASVVIYRNPFQVQSQTDYFYLVHRVGIQAQKRSQADGSEVLAFLEIGVVCIFL